MTLRVVVAEVSLGSARRLSTTTPCQVQSPPRGGGDFLTREGAAHHAQSPWTQYSSFVSWIINNRRVDYFSSARMCLRASRMLFTRIVYLGPPTQGSPSGVSFSSTKGFDQIVQVAARDRRRVSRVILYR